MSETSTSWSPADNPHAIAVSEAQAWFRCALLISRRIHDGDDDRSPGYSSRQLDARQFVVALWQLLMAESLQQFALRDLGIDQAVLVELSRARQRFEKAVPGIKHMRDALMHFDEWSRGVGSGPQKKAVRAGQAPRDVASLYWNFGYDPQNNTITLGPSVIEIEAAVSAAKALADSIYLAGRAVDERAAVEVRARTVEAISAAGSLTGSPGDAVKVSPGRDTKIWVSFDARLTDDSQRVSEAIIAALAAANLELASFNEPQCTDLAERLRAGEALYVAEAVDMASDTTANRDTP